MGQYAQAAEVFENSFLEDDYFESMSAEFAKNALINIIRDNKVGLLFLLGEPGVGKTYMLHLLKAEFAQQRRILMAAEPFGTPESFLQFLLKNSGHDATLSLSEMKEHAVELYTALPHLIMIDEAQLLSDSVLEYIRILSDTGIFRFILSMHAQEGEAILKKPHFASRDHRVVMLGLLQSSEVRNYMESQLLRHSLGELSQGFGQKEIDAIARHASGNFRMVKQMLKRIFSLMDYAKANGIASHSAPNRCVVTMAAIDLGCIDA